MPVHSGRPVSRYVVAAIVAAVVAVVAVQNPQPVTVTFATWQFEAVPLVVLILVPLALGIVIAGVPLWLQRWRLRVRLRNTEARLDALERRARPDPPSTTTTP